MLKGAIVRLLLFGIPFSFGYVATRPARPAAPTPAFVICAYPDGHVKIVARAEDCAAGSTILIPAARTLPEPAPADPAEGVDKTVNLPF